MYTHEFTHFQHYRAVSFSLAVKTSSWSFWRCDLPLVRKWFQTIREKRRWFLIKKKLPTPTFWQVVRGVGEWVSAEPNVNQNYEDRGEDMNEREKGNKWAQGRVGKKVQMGKEYRGSKSQFYWHLFLGFNPKPFCWGMRFQLSCGVNIHFINRLIYF